MTTGQLLPEPGFGSMQVIRPWIVGLIGELAVMKASTTSAISSPFDVNANGGVVW